MAAGSHCVQPAATKPVYSCVYSTPPKVNQYAGGRLYYVHLQVSVDVS